LSPASTSSRKSVNVGPLTVDEYASACRELITLDNGLPLELEDFQLEIIADLLSGVRELHVRVPEENGKTTLLAAVTLIHLLSTPDPRVAVGARNKDQAKVLFNQAVKMVQDCAPLEGRLDIRDGTNEIRILGMKGGAGLRVIPADALTAHGGINTLVVLDEMHALPGLGLFRTLAGKIGKRNGQIITISTAGEPDSEYEQLWDNVIATAHTVERRGPRCTRAEGPHHVAWGWALDPDDDPEDLALVKLANPASWITLKTLTEKRSLPSWSLKHWLTVVCDRPTRDYDRRFLQEPDWDAANVSSDVSRIPAGVPVLVGADWGFIDDATAYVVAWYSDGYLLLDEAIIVAPPRDGRALSPMAALQPLIDLDERNPIAVIAHDAAMQGAAMQGLLAEAFPNAEVVSVTPADMNTAPHYFANELGAGRLKHTGGPDLKRHLMNTLIVPVKNDPERYRIDRPVSSRHAPHLRPMREIDAAVAAVNVVWGAVGREPGLEPFIEYIDLF